MADDRDKSARYVLGGKRHDGSKGKKYTKWRENFLDAAEGEGDADWSMAQQFLGQVRVRSRWSCRSGVRHRPPRPNGR